jgi:multidrug efflux pump
MGWLVDWVVDRSRLTMSVIIAITLMGTFAYLSIPKEADPDIPIPFFGVTVFLPGVSPEDSERLLVRPLETQLKSVEGLKQLRATAGLGYGAITLEFDVNFNKERALSRIRDKVDLAKAELPSEADQPLIQEFNIALQPIITVVLSGDVPERAMLQTAKRLKRQFESTPGVLEATLNGAREDLLEIVIDPGRLESYGLSADDLFAVVRTNNLLVPAGALDTGRGRFQVKVPGLFETADDVLRLPIKVNGDRVVTLRDVAEVRRTFLDAISYVRYNGKPSISIDVTKRIGENIVDTIGRIKAVVDADASKLPPGVSVEYSGDQSYFINAQLTQLTNVILLAIILVMTVVVAVLGLRSGLITGFSIPASFLIGFLALYWGGYTINIMILFGMVITVGLLVDNAIIVVEYADRRMTEGFAPSEAFRDAAKRMFWPVVSSTATTLAAFAPMLFWPGVSGKFMFYLPLTMIFIMSASMVVCLLFLPTIGALVGKPDAPDARRQRDIELSESGNVFAISGWTGLYAQIVRWSVYHPLLVLLIALGTLGGVTAVFIADNKGVEFFVETDTDFAAVRVRARGNLSAQEKRDLIVEVEKRVVGLTGLKGVNSFTSSGQSGGGGFGGGSAPIDTIGQIFVELLPYHERGPSKPIMAALRKRVENVPGMYVELFEFQGGPPTGKAIQVEVGSENYVELDRVTAIIRKHLETMEGLSDIEDSRPLPGIEWALAIDREQAGRFGANVASVGATVQLVTTGIKVGTYRPDDADDEVDIRVRFPLDDRGIGALDRLRVNTRDGTVPITNFVSRKAKPQVSRYERVDSVRVWNIRSGVKTDKGFNTAERITAIKKWIGEQNFDSSIRIKFRGSDEQQNESTAFLGNAFLVALLVIGGILIVQFNNFWHSLVILSAVILSIIGVMLGLIIEQQAFSVIMSGTGIVALMGVMVNHNIVLVDTFHHTLAKGYPPMDAIVRTGVQRLRPVVLTTVTAVLGLLPLLYKFDVNFFTREVHFGGPSSDWWVPLATAIVYGLTFSTLLTLIVTPAMLALEHRYWSAERHRWGQWSDSVKLSPAE